MAKVLSGAVQGLISAIIVLPLASVVHAKGVEAHLNFHWWVIITIVPLACVTMASLGLLLGTSFEPRNIGLMFGFIILPVTFLGGTYYEWTRLAPVEVGQWHWLQTVVLVNPLIYINEGMRAAFTNAPHMHLYIVYPVVVGFLVALPGARSAELPAPRALLTLAPVGGRPPVGPASRRAGRPRSASRPDHGPGHPPFRPRLRGAAA